MTFDKNALFKDLCAEVEKAISHLQWMTNTLPLTEAQHIKLGDNIVDLHDKLEALKKSWEKAN